METVYIKIETNNPNEVQNSIGNLINIEILKIKSISSTQNKQDADAMNGNFVGVLPMKDPDSWHCIAGCSSD